MLLNENDLAVGTVDTLTLVCASFENDIGQFIGKIHELSDLKKHDLLVHPWTPSVDYQFSFCIVNKNGKATRKYAQRSHLDKFHWLVLSAKDQGLYCKYCAIFMPLEGGSGRYGATNLGKLVKTPLKKFDDLLGEKGALNVHDKSKYHAAAVELGKNFLISYKNPQKEIVNQLSSQRLAQVKENRERLRPIVETVVFLGRNNLPLRGHRHSGTLRISDNRESSEIGSVVAQEGVFREMLRFRVESRDTVLERHLNCASAKATYISSVTQNEIINCCTAEIQNSIVHRVKKASVYSIIFDETTDASHIEQL